MSELTFDPRLNEWRSPEPASLAGACTGHLGRSVYATVDLLTGQPLLIRRVGSASSDAVDAAVNRLLADEDGRRAITRLAIASELAEDDVSWRMPWYELDVLDASLQIELVAPVFRVDPSSDDFEAVLDHFSQGVYAGTTANREPLAAAAARIAEKTSFDYREPIVRPTRPRRREQKLDAPSLVLGETPLSVGYDLARLAGGDAPLAVHIQDGELHVAIPLADARRWADEVIAYLVEPAREDGPVVGIARGVPADDSIVFRFVVAVDDLDAATRHRELVMVPRLRGWSSPMSRAATAVSVATRSAVRLQQTGGPAELVAARLSLAHRHARLLGRAAQDEVRQVQDRINEGLSTELIADLR